MINRLIIRRTIFRDCDQIWSIHFTKQRPLTGRPSSSTTRSNTIKGFSIIITVNSRRWYLTSAKNCVSKEILWNSKNRSCPLANTLIITHRRGRRVSARARRWISLVHPAAVNQVPCQMKSSWVKQGGKNCAISFQWWMRSWGPRETSATPSAKDRQIEMKKARWVWYRIRCKKREI